jgi:hypothetical protein
MNEKVVCPFATRRCNEDCKALLRNGECVIMERQNLMTEAVIKMLPRIIEIEQFIQKIAVSGNDIKRQ